MTKTRLEAFTDAVIAIIMTILVLELPRPSSDQLTSLVELSPHLGVYLITFMILAVYWVNHHHLLHSIKKINGKILWVNLIFLFLLSLIPFFSNWLSHHVNSFIPELSYVVLLTSANFTYYYLTKQLIKINSNLYLSDTTIKKNLLSLILNFLSIVLGYVVAPIFMLLTSAIVFSLWLIPNRKVEKL